MTDQPASCGTCTLCCKVKHVPDFPAKQRHEWCSHCEVGRGCRIYADRPEPCREHECLWLMSQRDPGHELTPGMRPDRCKIVIDPLPEGAGIVCFVDTARPDAWQHGEAGRFLEAAQQRGLRVIIACGHSRTLLTVAPG